LLLIILTDYSEKLVFEERGLIYMASITIEDELYLEIKKILNKYENNEKNLLAMLLEIQGVVPEKYIPKEVAKYIGEYLGVKPARI